MWYLPHNTYDSTGSLTRPYKFALLKPMLIVLTTLPNAEEAEILAGLIVERKLAACVQIMPQMTSIYFWEGEIKNETEHLLTIKTLPEKYDELEAFIKANHSYRVPEITAVRCERMLEPYFDWMKNYLT